MKTINYWGEYLKNMVSFYRRGLREIVTTESRSTSVRLGECMMLAASSVMFVLYMYVALTVDNIWYSLGDGAISLINGYLTLFWVRQIYLKYKVGVYGKGSSIQAP